MKLFVHILIHVLSSIVTGFIVYLFNGQLLISLMAAFIGGTLIDIDHLIDYYIVFGSSFKLKYFFQGYQYMKGERLFIVFHGFEHVFIFIFLSVFIGGTFLKPLFQGIGAGMLVHLIFDSLLNDVPLSTYSLTQRIFKDFSLPKLVSKKHYQKHLKQKRKISF